MKDTYQRCYSSFLCNLTRTLFFLIMAVSLGSCHVVRFFVYNFADIHDYKKFPKMDLPKGDNTFVFPVDKSSGVKVPSYVMLKHKKYDFMTFLKKTKTVAFIVIRNDTVLGEKYLYGYSDSSIVPSFSMAKSFVSMLVGIAIDEGAIKDVNESITKYLPELTRPGFDQITIENLLDMQSGIKFNEGYLNPFGDVAKFYYGTNLNKYITKLKIEKKPGQGFEYESVNAQLLGMIVERAVHKPLAEYMEDKVWKYIGAEYNASWSIDSRRDKEAKAFCCFNARPKDFAKLGRLYLNNGKWNGRQIVSEKWVKQSLAYSGSKNNGIYSYQWWHTQGSEGKDFFAKGLLGQYVYMYPEKNIIIVRLGKKEGANFWAYVLRDIAMSY